MADAIFEVKIDGLDKLQAALARSAEVVKPILQQAIDRTPAILAKYTVTGIVPYRTGQLIETFRQSLGVLQASWHPTVSYAPFVEFGTDPHWIEPTSGYLWWPGAAHPVARVFHPGYKGNPFMERIRDHATDEINETFQEALGVITSRLATQSK